MRTLVLDWIGRGVSIREMVSQASRVLSGYQLL